MQSTRTYWTWGLVTMTCLSSAAAVAAEQQQDAQTDGTVLATVVVTGSNVRGSSAEAMAPLQVLDRAQITNTNAAQLSELLQDVPANTGSQLYSESGQLSGTSQFSLRGLGFSSTLTLINGRRAGVSPLSDASGADFLDINQFPLSMVERVEVLKDGASAIYGSEAVAGVVNIVTRRGFEGIELSTDYQDATNQMYSINLAAGLAFDRGSFNLYATYLDQTANHRSDFDWLMQRVGGNGVPGRSLLLSNNGYPGSFSRAAFNSAGQPIVASGAVMTADPTCEAAGGVHRINDDGVVDTSRCSADFTDQTAVIPAQRRMQAFAEFTYDISDRATFFNETSVSSNLNLIPVTSGGFSNGVGVDSAAGFVYIPAEHPFNFFIEDPADPLRIVYVDPRQWDPDIHQAVALVGSFRPEGPHYGGDKRQKNDYFRTANGLTWQLAPDWTASFSHGYAFARFEENDPIGVDAAALNDALVSGTYNPFGTSIVDPTLVSPKDGTSVAANSRMAVEQFFYPKTSVARTDQQVFDASLSGSLLRLPAGDVAVAIGGQYRELRLRVLPDSLFASGGGTSSALSPSFDSSQDVMAGYAEALLPVHERLDMQIAVRHENYGGAVGSSTDPKIGARLQVLDGLHLRGTWGTSFQAPTLTQRSTSTARLIINDPVSVDGAGQITCGASNRAGNAFVETSGSELEPQSSENFSVGLDARPTAHLMLAADYWRYDYSNLIAAAQNGQSIIDGECATGRFVPDPRVTRSSNGLIQRIRSNYVNVGKVVTDGVDLSAAYSLPAGNLGTFRLQVDGTYINKFDVYDADGIASDRVGSRNFNNNFAPMPRWRASAMTGWNRGPHSAAVSVRFTDSYRNDQSNNAPIDSYTTFGVQYTLSLDGLLLKDASSSLTVGVDNLFDTDPPSLIRYTRAGEPVTGISSVDRPGYDALAGVDIRGRIVHARFLQQFR